MESKSGRLYVVATPIGNLGDITLRALEILRCVDAIACEDTRRTQKLLTHYKIHPKEIFSLHKFNERARMKKVLGMVEQGRNVALVSDAGTPTLSDPGHVLIHVVAERGIPIEPIPGPSALVAALCASGLEADRFLFDGFLPRKTRERKARLALLVGESRTLIFYETPHRLQESLRDMLKMLGNRSAVLAREITKLHEEIVRKNLQGLLDTVHGWEKSRGEIVLIVEGCKIPANVVKKSGGDVAEVLQDSAGNPVDIVRKLQSREGFSRRDATRRVAEQFGLSRQDLYRRLAKETTAR